RTEPGGAPVRAHLERVLHMPEDEARIVDGYGEADADAAGVAAGRVERRVDADHLAPAVEQRATGVAGIDGGIGLDVVVELGEALIAVERADDAGRHRVLVL